MRLLFSNFILDRGLVALLDAFEKCASIKCTMLWGNFFEKESSQAITRLQQEGILKEGNRNSDVIFLKESKRILTAVQINLGVKTALIVQRS